MQNTEIKKLGGGLTRSVPDTRHFKFGQIYTLPKLSEIVDEFDVSTPIRIKNQDEFEITDYCTAYGGTSVSEDQEAIEIDPLYQFFLGKQIEGKPDGWGCDLISMAKSFINYGSLERKISPVSISTPRSVILDPKTWEMVSKEGVEAHKKVSFMIVSGPYDTFDNIRATLWKSKTLGLNQSILTGVTWAGQWTYAEGGIIDESAIGTFGHAFKIFGVAKKKGQLMLKAQLSNGTEIGDKGIFYFSRDVVNEQFSYEAIIFTDMPQDEIKYHLDIKQKADAKVGLFMKIVSFIKYLIQTCFTTS